MGNLRLLATSFWEALVILLETTRRMDWRWYALMIAMVLVSCVLAGVVYQ